MNYFTVSLLYIIIFHLSTSSSCLHVRPQKTSKIKSIVIKTSNCQFCGMGWHGSNLRLKICKQPSGYSPKIRATRSVGDSSIIDNKPFNPISLKIPEPALINYLTWAALERMEELASQTSQTKQRNEVKLECCHTNRFDKAYYQDFRPGLETEYLESQILGECANFEFETSLVIEEFLTAKHEGSDSLKLDWIEVRTNKGERIKCTFSSMFTNNDYSSECKLI